MDAASPVDCRVGCDHGACRRASSPNSRRTSRRGPPTVRIQVGLSIEPVEDRRVLPFGVDGGKDRRLAGARACRPARPRSRGRGGALSAAPSPPSRCRSRPRRAPPVGVIGLCRPREVKVNVVTFTLGGRRREPSEFHGRVLERRGSAEVLPGTVVAGHLGGMIRHRVSAQERHPVRLQPGVLLGRGVGRGLRLGDEPVGGVPPRGRPPLRIEALEALITSLATAGSISRNGCVCRSSRSSSQARPSSSVRVSVMVGLR